MIKHGVVAHGLHPLGASCEEYQCSLVYLASDVTALETRLIACETAMLLGCNVNHPGIQAYFGTYPDPYIPE